MKIKNIQIKNFKGLHDISITNCSRINAFLGKNNSGKSSILHAIDIASLAITVNTWNSFQPKLEIKDLINRAGDFEIKLEYESNIETIVKSSPDFTPVINNRQANPPKSILILPDVGMGMLSRQHRTPQWVIKQLDNKQFQNVNSLDILYAIKFYSIRNDKGLTSESYTNILREISFYFPDIINLNSDRTEQDISTLTYEEYGKKLDILYSGTGLKHFLDILIKITLSGAKIVLLDEPELGLHPDLQRRFLDYLEKLSKDKGLQVFIGTHSQVILNYANSINFYRVINNNGEREIKPVQKEAIHTVLSDLGLRPSDLFNQDICLMVEGASEVIFYEHVIRQIYASDFDAIAIGIIQYGGGAAEGIVSGAIDVSNIVPSQKYLLWTRDRDAKPTQRPSTASTRFKNKIESVGYTCLISRKREIEYYYPIDAHIEAQQGDEEKINYTKGIYYGDQSKKYRKVAEQRNVCVPNGIYLKRLLKKHLTDKQQLDSEIKTIIEDYLIPWKQEIIN